MSDNDDTTVLDELNAGLDDDLDAIIGKDEEELEQEQSKETETPPEESETPPEQPKETETPPEAETPPETPPEETPPETPPETPEVQEPKPLTADEIRTIISEVRTEERASTKDVDTLTDEIMNIYYPGGLSNAVTDENGKEYKTPQDVVDAVTAAGGEMTIEQASEWLTNEQFKLDKQINDIKQSAREVAEVNANFRNGGIRVMQKYKEVFDKFPGLQSKVFKNYMRSVKMDTEKDLIMSAPDIEEHYAEFLEPYVLAAQASSQAPAPSPPAEEKPQIPDAKQTVNDRLDETGDGGTSGGDDEEADPNDPDSSLDKMFKE